MHFLSDEEEDGARRLMMEAATAAKEATCLRSKCGCVIVKDGAIIGRGFNSPPGNLETQRRCSCEKESYHRKVTDKTCCVHAEERAVIDALRRNPGKVEGSVLYFIRLDAEGMMSMAGKPYCTICSKMALDVGIAAFALWHEKGICVYDTQEYNTLSFGFDGK